MTIFHFSASMSNAVMTEVRRLEELPRTPLSVVENLREIMDKTHESCLVEWDRAAQFFENVQYVNQDKTWHLGRLSLLTICDFRARTHATFVLDPFPHWEVFKVGGQIILETMIWDYDPHEYQPKKFVCATCKLRSD